MFNLIEIGEKLTFRGKECVEIPSASFVRMCNHTKATKPGHYPSD